MILSTEQVRYDYGQLNESDTPGGFHAAVGEFDAWLKAHDAAVWDEGYEQAVYDEGFALMPTENPYRD